MLRALELITRPHDTVDRGRWGAGSVVLSCLAAAGCAAMLLSAPAHGQSTHGERPPPREVTILGGFGNAMGWLGAQAELYFEGDRLSAFAGAGYLPGGELDPRGPAAALGLRAFTAGDNHRAVLGLSVSQIKIEDILVRNSATGDLEQVGSHLYGPGLTAGYQYVADSGFTGLISAGLGVALGQDDSIDDGPLTAMLNLGLGYTVR